MKIKTLLFNLIIRGSKVIPVPDQKPDDKTGRYYVELPDGYRLIFDRSGYVGRYEP